jgi:hypothetical protein
MNMIFDGDIMGVVDNLILAICAYWGVDIDKKLGGNGVQGALTGALLGNAVSDLAGAALDPSTRHLAWGIFAGCMYVFIVVKLWEIVQNLYESWKGYKEII